MKPAPRGIVLITILLIFAGISVIVVSLQQQMLQSIVHFGQARASAQSYQYHLGAEILAGVLLRQDLMNDYEKEGLQDSTAEVWSKIQSFPVEGGQIRSVMLDMQGRFNLTELTANPKAQEVFIRLLQVLEIPSDDNLQAEDVVQIILDWIDPDQQQKGFIESEDNFYLNRGDFERPESSPTSSLAALGGYGNASESDDSIFDRDADQPSGREHYITASQAPRHISELLLMRGIQRADYIKLLPYITILPKDTPLNINTISEILALALVPVGGDQLVRQRPEQGYTAEEVKVLPQATQPPLNYGVTSEYFELRSEITLADNVSQLSSVLHRAKLPAKPQQIDEIELPKVVDRDGVWSIYYTLTEDTPDEY